MKFCVDNINLVLFLPLIVCFLIFANSLIANRLDRRFVLWLSGVVSFICLLSIAFRSTPERSLRPVDPISCRFAFGSRT